MNKHIIKAQIDRVNSPPPPKKKSVNWSPRRRKEAKEQRNI